VTTAEANQRGIVADVGREIARQVLDHDDLKSWLKQYRASRNWTLSTSTAWKTCMIRERRRQANDGPRFLLPCRPRHPRQVPRDE
jgi:hypothetical protein